MKKQKIITEFDLNELGSMGDFPSVTTEWKENNANPDSFKVVLLDTMEEVPYSAGDSIYSSGYWHTNIYTDGKPYDIFDSEENGLDFCVSNATYVAQEHIGTNNNGIQNKWYYTVYTSDEEALKRVIDSLGGYLGLFNKDDCEKTNELSSSTIYNRQKIKNKTL